MARVPFKMGLPAVAARAFVRDGKSYAVGDPFPYEALGLAHFDVSGLWLADLINFVPAETSPSPVPQPAAKREKHHHKRW